MPANGFTGFNLRLTLNLVLNTLSRVVIVSLLHPSQGASFMGHFIRAMLLFIYFLATMFLAATTEAGAPWRVRILARVGEGLPQNSPAVDITKNQNCTLAVLLEESAPSGAKHYYAAEPGTALVSGRKIEVARWDRPEPLTIQWFKVEPLMMHPTGKGADPTVPDFLWYTNAYCPSSPRKQAWIGFDRIEYRNNPLPAGTNKWSIPADAHPTDRRYDLNGGLGVMRYHVEVTLGGKTWKTSGAESTEELGIREDVFRLTVRRDDSYVGCATSFFNVPGVFGSVGKQVDHYQGVDCADLVIGVYRKWKKADLEYTNVNGLLKCMKSASGVLYLADDGSLGEDKALSRPCGVKFREGLAVIFDYPGTVEGHYDHVAILCKDNGNGVVDGNDIILQCGPMEPRLDYLKSQGCPKTDPTRLRLLAW